MPAPSESILSMNSTDWRQKFTRSTPKVPLRKAVLDESSFLDGDEDSLLQTHVFREAIHSIPTINASEQHDGRKHMRQQFLFDLIRCPLTKQLYHDPVCASDGFTYEKKAILEHCKTDQRPPMTIIGTSTTYTTEASLTRTLGFGIYVGGRIIHHDANAGIQTYSTTTSISAGVLGDEQAWQGRPWGVIVRAAIRIENIAPVPRGGVKTWQWCVTFCFVWAGPGWRCQEVREFYRSNAGGLYSYWRQVTVNSFLDLPFLVLCLHTASEMFLHTHLMTSTGLRYF